MSCGVLRVCEGIYTNLAPLFLYTVTGVEFFCKRRWYGERACYVQVRRFPASSATLHRRRLRSDEASGDRDSGCGEAMPCPPRIGMLAPYSSASYKGHPYHV